jgi:hypothetical protein
MPTSQEIGPITGLFFNLKTIFLGLKKGFLRNPAVEVSSSFLSSLYIVGLAITSKIVW